MMIQVYDVCVMLRTETRGKLFAGAIPLTVSETWWQVLEARLYVLLRRCHGFVFKIHHRAFIHRLHVHVFMMTKEQYLLIYYIISLYTYLS